MQEVVLVQACRTAFGNFGGALRSIPPVEMGLRSCKKCWEEAEYLPWQWSRW